MRSEDELVEIVDGGVRRLTSDIWSDDEVTAEYGWELDGDHITVRRRRLDLESPPPRAPTGSAWRRSG